jgi:hypothetical protein
MDLMKQMLSTSEKVSSIRGVMLAIALVIIFKFMAFNVAALVRNTNSANFSPTDITMLAFALSGKLIQKTQEKKQ